MATIMIYLIKIPRVYIYRIDAHIYTYLWQNKKIYSQD